MARAIIVEWLPASFNKPGRWSVSSGAVHTINSATDFSLASDVAQSFAQSHGWTGEYAEGVIENRKGIVDSWVFVRIGDSNTLEVS